MPPISPRIARRLLSLAVATTAVAALPATASAVEPGVVLTGVSNRINEVSQAADLLSPIAADRKWARVFMTWATVEPSSKGNIDPNVIAGYDQRIKALRADGIKVLLIVTTAPNWSHPTVNDITAPPDNPNDFADFMAFLADRYAGQVQGFELWNEPDDRVHWRNGPQPAAYAGLVKAAYPKIKAALAAKGADATVTTAGMVGNNFEFLEQLYANGIKGHMDAVGVHTDTACLLREPEFYYREESGRVGRFSFTGYREVHQTMVNHGDGHKQVWMTEMGWSTTPGICTIGTDAGKKPGGVSAAQQAEFLKRAYACLQSDPYVGMAVWFSLQDYSESEQYDHRLGLIDFDGTRKPAFGAFQTLWTGAGPAPNPNCGGKVDTDAPTVTATVPGEYFDRLAIRATATDPTTPVTRMELYADGVKVPGGQDGGRFELDWLGAGKLSFGEHTIEVRAYDEARNVGKAVFKVRRLDPRKAPATLVANFAFKVVKKPGRRLLITARVTAPKGALEKPKGRVRIFVERKSGRRWKPISRYTKGISRRIAISYKARTPGRWRVRARFNASKPYKSAVAKTFTFKL